MTYAEVWLSEMWRPVHSYGWTDKAAEEAFLRMAAEKRAVQRAARKARERSTVNPQAVCDE